MPVAGRRFLDYALEAAVKFGVSKASIVDWNFSRALADEMATRENPACAVESIVGSGPNPRGIDDLARIAGILPPDDVDVLLVWGIALPLYRPGESSRTPVSAAEMADTPTGIYRRIGGEWLRVEANGILRVCGAPSYLAMNTALLRGDGGYTLPGYSAERGVHLCRNVVIERGVDVSPPVLLQDGAWCARFSTLAGFDAIGRGAFVGEGTRLIRTIVCDDTYVGDGLVFEDKIIWHNRVIDAVSGGFDDIEDAGLVSSMEMHRNRSWLSRFGSFLAGRSHGSRAG